MRNDIKDIVANSQVLYKYIGDPNVALRILSNSELQISSPKNFNDPFDCYDKLLTFHKISDKDVEILERKYGQILPDQIATLKTIKKVGILKYFQIVKVMIHLRNITQQWAFPAFHKIFAVI